MVSLLIHFQLPLILKVSFHYYENLDKMISCMWLPKKSAAANLPSKLVGACRNLRGLRLQTPGLGVLMSSPPILGWATLGLTVWSRWLGPRRWPPLNFWFYLLLFIFILVLELVDFGESLELHNFCMGCSH